MYLMLTGYYNDNDKEEEWEISVNMDTVSWVVDKGEKGSKLKFASGNSLGEIEVRQSFCDINAALNPVAVYTQKEQPK